MQTYTLKPLTWYTPVPSGGCVAYTDTFANVSWGVVKGLDRGWYCRRYAVGGFRDFEAASRLDAVQMAEKEYGELATQFLRPVFTPCVPQVELPPKVPLKWASDYPPTACTFVPQSAKYKIGDHVTCDGIIIQDGTPLSPICTRTPIINGLSCNGITDGTNSTSNADALMS